MLVLHFSKIAEVSIGWTMDWMDGRLDRQTNDWSGKSDCLTRRFVFIGIDSERVPSSKRRKWFGLSSIPYDVFEILETS